MNQKEKCQNPISHSIKESRDQIMKFFGPLI
jgi:hypothetical protein